MFVNPGSCIICPPGLGWIQLSPRLRNDLRVEKQASDQRLRKDIHQGERVIWSKETRSLFNIELLEVALPEELELEVTREKTELHRGNAEFVNSLATQRPSDEGKKKETPNEKATTPQNTSASEPHAIIATFQLWEYLLWQGVQMFLITAAWPISSQVRAILRMVGARGGRSEVHLPMLALCGFQG